jgi:hypothetical protein
MRIALECEVTYASNYPFVDYGADLHIMAEMEKGVHIEKLMRSEADMKPHATKAKDVELFLSKLRPRRYDKVPLEFTGKGPNGYMLYDWIFHRSVRAPKVT